MKWGWAGHISRMKSEDDILIPHKPKKRTPINKMD